MNTGSSKEKYFLYARKSSEAEDRQVASIESQIEELKNIASIEGLTIIDILFESCSAKAPGRPIFNKMLTRIRKGEAKGILCWKLDRLARNPVDGGQITWMLQRGIIQHIQTYERSYYPWDNVLMMSVEFGMANQYVIDLSLNVKRGLNKKVKEGIFPACAPLGYLNSPDRESGNKIIVEDPDRFVLIRRMWNLMLTGNYTPPQILKIANTEWGFKTPKHRTQGGKPLCRSSIYNIFNNPFYYGYFEWPKSSTQLHKGMHRPMITEKEFETVQRLLHKPFSTAPRKREFPFTGILSCGECGCAITAEEKNQIICPDCKLKFAIGEKTACPGCAIPIKKMVNPKILRYTYYHCTKKKVDVKCKQKSLTQDEFLNQFQEFLKGIQINKKYLAWSLSHLRKKQKSDDEFRQKEELSKKAAVKDIDKKLNALVDMRINNEIDEHLFNQKKGLLTRQKEQCLAGRNEAEWISQTEEIFNYAHHAGFNLKTAIMEGKVIWQRELFSTLARIGSNLTLTDKKLNIDNLEPFYYIKKGITSVPEASEGFEPELSVANKRENTVSVAVNPRWLAVIDSIRTYYKSQPPSNILNIHKESDIRLAG